MPATHPVINLVTIRPGYVGESAVGIWRIAKRKKPIIYRWVVGRKFLREGLGTLAFFTSAPFDPIINERSKGKGYSWVSAGTYTNSNPQNKYTLP